MRIAPLIQGIIALSFALPLQVAADYYVSNDGNDSNDGQSPQTPWATIDRINSTKLESGADVWFMSGDTWHDQQLVVDWDGSNADPVKIGCYKMAGQQAVACEANDRLPEINGTLDQACLANLSCSIDGQLHDGSPGPRAVPASRWDGLISIKANHVHISNLKIMDSAGSAISTQNNQNRRGYVFENLEVKRTAVRLISFGRETRDIIVRNSSFSNFNYCDYGNGNYNPWKVCERSGWAGGIFIWDSVNANALIENNLITRGFGEGINCLQSSHVIARGNRIGNLRSARIYLDNCSNSLVENNVTWGDPGLDWHFTEAGGSGVSVSLEDYSWQLDSTDNVIRNNIFSGVGQCISMGIQEEVIGSWKIGAEIYGNTCLHPRSYGINLRNLPAETFEKLVIKNNIFYGPNAQNLECKIAADAASVVETSNNLFSSTNKITDACFGSDTVIGEPKIELSEGQAIAASHNNLPEPATFKLLSSSPALRSGVALNHKLGNVEFGEAQVSEFECSDSVSEAFGYDFNCRNRPSPPSMGAIEPYRPLPLPPTIISIR